MNITISPQQVSFFSSSVWSPFLPTLFSKNGIYWLILYCSITRGEKKLFLALFPYHAKFVNRNTNIMNYSYKEVLFIEYLLEEYLFIWVASFLLPNHCRLLRLLCIIFSVHKNNVRGKHNSIPFQKYNE